MEASFIDSLPKDLLINVRSMCGPRGEEWLRCLPERIEELERFWDVRIETVFPTAGINFVAPATTIAGGPVVLKLNPPYETTEFVSECAYLRSRNGVGCVRLINEQAESRAILLEQAVPGETMDVIFGESEPQCVAPAIDLLRMLSETVTEPPTEAICLDKWFENLDRARGTAFPSDYISKASEIYDRLGGSRVMYIHGDYHPRNIVSATREPFLVIDPKGIEGSLGYDIAVFLNNFHWWQDDKPDIRERLAVAVRQFAEELGFTERELREWAFAQMVLSAWWTFDELPDEYDNEVVKADIWSI